MKFIFQPLQSKYIIFSVTPSKADPGFGKGVRVNFHQRQTILEGQGASSPWEMLKSRS